MLCCLWCVVQLGWHVSAALMQFKCTARFETCHCLQIMQMRKWFICNTLSLISITCFSCNHRLLDTNVSWYWLLVRAWVLIWFSNFLSLFYVLHLNTSLRLAYYKHVKKAIPIRFIAYLLFKTLHVQSRDIRFSLLGKLFAYLWRRRLNQRNSRFFAKIIVAKL